MIYFAHTGHVHETIPAPASSADVWFLIIGAGVFVALVVGIFVARGRSKPRANT